VQPDNGRPRAADAALDGLTRRSHELRERAEQSQAELAAILESVRSGDGLATVTVGAGGILRNLELATGATRADASTLSRSIMTAYQDGCRRAGERAAEIIERLAPGSPAVAMMREAIPPDPDPTDPAPRPQPGYPEHGGLR
jgi:DNA-binding protein YbaB